MANQKEVGEHLGLTKQYVSNLVSQGILPKGIGRGGMDMDACRKAYIEYLRQRARLHLKDVPNDINEEKLRLTKNQADHKEIEVAVKTFLETSFMLLDYPEIEHIPPEYVENLIKTFSRMRILNQNGSLNIRMF